MGNGAQNILGRLGVWTLCDTLSMSDLTAMVRQLEAWGYGALWLPETVGRDPLVTIASLACHTQRLAFATGITNIYARDAVTMKAIHRTLSELLPGRFVLGLGVSHEHLVTKLRGHAYRPPLAAMSEYLDAFDAALYRGPEPEHVAPVVLAGLRAPMLRLAARRAQGAHPYLVTAEHTRRARAVLGPQSWLCPEQMVLGESVPDKARALGRLYLKPYLRLPNYQRNLRDFGFSDDDFAAGGSDRVIDALIAWGEPSKLRDHIDAHFAAGADHVCIQPLRPDGSLGPDLELLAQLAPAGSA